MQCLKCGNDFDDHYECPLCAAAWRESSLFTRVVTRIEDFLIAFFLGTMVVMVLLQVFMRNFFQSGVPGGDDLIRHLVLWIAFVGAGIATRSKSHVRIDVLTHFVGNDKKRYLDVLVSLFSAGVSTVLAVAAFQFVQIEFEMQAHSRFLHLPVWVFQIIMPAGYLIISMRFARHFCTGVRDIFRGESF